MRWTGGGGGDEGGGGPPGGIEMENGDVGGPTDRVNIGCAGQSSWGWRGGGDGGWMWAMTDR